MHGRMIFFYFSCSCYRTGDLLSSSKHKFYRLTFNKKRRTENEQQNLISMYQNILLLTQN